MVNVEITRTSIEHLDDIMVIERLSFKIPWSRDAFVEELTKNKLAVYLSAKADGRVIGYAGMWCICGEGHITNIAVHPEYRRTGVGSKLLESLIEYAKQHEITAMTLEVRKSNLAAQQLYKKFGFVEAGMRKSYYADNGEDAIIMWKSDILR